MFARTVEFYLKASLGRLSNAIETYMSYEESQSRFLVIARRSKRFLSLQQKTSLRNVKSPLVQSENVDTEALKLPDATNIALHYRTYFLFNRFHFVILDYELYAHGAIWNELAKYAVHCDAPLLISCSLPVVVATVLRNRTSGACYFKRHWARRRLSASSCTTGFRSFRYSCVPNRSVVHTKLSWADIGTHLTKNRSQTSHTGHERERNLMPRAEGESHFPKALMHHHEVALEEEVIHTTVSGSSFIRKRMQWKH